MLHNPFVVHCVPKNKTLFLIITAANVNRFSNIFHCAIFLKKFLRTRGPLQRFPPHPKCVSVLWNLNMKILPISTVCYELLSCFSLSHFITNYMKNLLIYLVHFILTLLTPFYVFVNDHKRVSQIILNDVFAPQRRSTKKIKNIYLKKRIAFIKTCGSRQSFSKFPEYNWLKRLGFCNASFEKIR